MTSEAPQVWYVMLRNEEAAGKVIVPLKPFLRFSRRIDKQIKQLEKRIRAECPQLARRGMLEKRRQT